MRLFESANNDIESTLRQLTRLCGKTMNRPVVDMKFSRWNPIILVTSELADNESSRLQQTVSLNIATATHFNFFKLTVGTIMTQVVAWTSKVNTTEMSTPEGLDPQLRRIVAWLEEFALRQFFFEVGMLVTHAHKIEVFLNLFFCCVLMKNILNSVF